MAKFRCGMAVEVLEYEPKAVSTQVNSYQVGDREMADDQNAPLETDEPRVVRIVLLKGRGNFMGFLKVEGFVRLARLNDAQFTHTYSGSSVD